MSAAEQSRDDAEPPSRLSNLYSVSVTIDDAVDETSVPPSEQITAWIEHVILGVEQDNNPIHYEVSVSVVDERAIQALNHKFRSNNKPTNVLSFQSAMPVLETAAHEPNYQALGDVVVCQSVIIKEAAEQHKTLEHHFAHMLVHSVLHLFGHDHEVEDDASAMEALEIQLLSDLSIPNPYQLSFQKP